MLGNLHLDKSQGLIASFEDILHIRHNLRDTW